MIGWLEKRSAIERSWILGYFLLRQGGSGLSGGWAAKELAEGGLDVIVLDAGPFLAGPEVLAPDACDVDQRGTEGWLWLLLAVAICDITEYYSEVVALLGVHGAEEGLTRLPDGVFLPAPRLTKTERAFKQAVESRWPERKVIAGQGIASGSTLSAAGAGGWPAKTSVGTTLRSAVSDIQANSIVSHLVNQLAYWECRGRRLCRKAERGIVRGVRARGDFSRLSHRICLNLVEFTIFNISRGDRRF